MRPQWADTAVAETKTKVTLPNAAPNSKVPWVSRSCDSIQALNRLLPSLEAAFRLRKSSPASRHAILNDLSGKAITNGIVVWFPCRNNANVFATLMELFPVESALYARVTLGDSSATSFQLGFLPQA
jgi:hypothetical protein